MVTAAAREVVNQLYGWLLANRWSLNIDKTCYMIFLPDKNNEIDIYVNDIEIKNVWHCRYIDVISDDQLKWTEHMQYVYNKLIRYSRIFYKLKDKLPVTLLSNVYYAFVQPHILYVIEICKYLPDSFKKTYEIK